MLVHFVSVAFLLHSLLHDGRTERKDSSRTAAQQDSRTRGRQRTAEQQEQDIRTAAEPNTARQQDSRQQNTRTVEQAGQQNSKRAQQQHRNQQHSTTAGLTVGLCARACLVPSFCCLPACALWFARFVCLYPLGGLPFAACLPVLCNLARFVPLRGRIVLRFGWFPAASCLYLLRGCLGACVSVIGGPARFMPFSACTCFVGGSRRLPACTLALGSFHAVWCLYLLRGWFLALACLHLGLGSFRAVSCLYLLRGWFLALACLHFGAWLVFSCHLVLVPASWLGFAACLPVVGGLARFRAVSCLYLLGGSPFAAFLPVLCALAGSVPFRACTCFVARFCRLPACSLWVGSFSCRVLLVSAWWFSFCRSPACALRFGWFRAVSGLYLLRGSVLPLAWWVASFSCRVLLASAWWFSFCRFPACALRFGWFHAVSCLYLLRGSVLPLACL